MVQFLAWLSPRWSHLQKSQLIFSLQNDIRPPTLDIADSAAKTRTELHIKTTEKKINKARTKLRGACKKGSYNEITKALDSILNTSLEANLANDIQAAQQILSSIEENESLDLEHKILNYAALVAFVVNRLGFFPLPTILKKIKRLTPQQRDGMGPEAFLDAVVDAVKPFAKVLPGLMPLFVKQQDGDFETIPKADAASKEWAEEFIHETEKKIDKKRRKLHKACEEKSVELITKSLLKIKRTPSRLVLVKEVEAAQIILKALTQDDSILNEPKEPNGSESSSSLASLNESKVMSNKITAIEEKNVVQAAVHKFTTIALMCLETNPLYPVADIMSQTKTSSVDTLFRDEFVARVVVHMKKDRRLKYIKDPHGRAAFMLSDKEGIESNNAVETAIQAQVTIFTAYALKTLEKIQYYHVANIHGQIKTSPVGGMKKEDFIACVVDRMKLNKQFNYTMDPRGNPAFKLASFKSTESSQFADSLLDSEERKGCHSAEAPNASVGSANMAAYFQSVMQEESIIKEAMKAFEAEAMKALETKLCLC
ncbi:unnamed protein product [Aphanomyces euteiches]|uniref:Uncharacterized protein n=1 Tax=Aphanomyces euteiches TaxID=100861 RepID=A0A6G0WQC2_9STRA|nr:hypothetical protein Ae201684_012862 [Aphanomyces euteiches]KAH9097543.1 hypothetical protein Ae201684P_001021 [Aphanomyces euteiches]